MLSQVIHQIFQVLKRTYLAFLLVFVVILICGCDQKRGEDYVKLDAPLEEVLPKITLVVPEEKLKTQPIEISVGSTYVGKGEYSIDEDNTHGFQYIFHNKHVVEGNKYIFTVVSYNWGGSGTFYYLTAIDKVTLKSVDEVFLGDRVEIQKISLEKPNSDTVTINYVDRKSGTAMTEKSDKPEEKHYGMHNGELNQYWIEKVE